MELGIIGLGGMGANMAQRLKRGKHRVVAFDSSAEARERAAAQGIAVAASLDELVSMLSAPRVLWLMAPAGEPTQQTLDALKVRLARVG